MIRKMLIAVACVAAGLFVPHVAGLIAPQPEPAKEPAPILLGEELDPWGASYHITAREPEIVEYDENQLIEDALMARANIIEDCTITYYCAERRPHICGTGNGITATGTKVTAGVSCAVDPRYIPYGSTVMVDFGDGELHYYTADDCGGAIKGNHIDLCVATHELALLLGTTTATVYWVEE